MYVHDPPDEQPSYQRGFRSLACSLAVVIACEAALDADFPRDRAEFPPRNRSVRLHRPALDAFTEGNPVGVPGEPSEKQVSYGAREWAD
jgi:hypothetical protein